MRYLVIFSICLVAASAFGQEVKFDRDTFEVWPKIEVPNAEFEVIKKANIQGLVDFIVETKDIPVLVFKDLPKGGKPNPEILSIQSSEGAQKAAAWYVEHHATAFERTGGSGGSLFSGGAAAQFMPPWAQNTWPPLKRPFVRRGIILLSSEADHASILHEYLHSIYQAKVFPNGIKWGDIYIHAYLYALIKSEEASSHVDKFNALFHQEREPLVEESIVWEETLSLASKMNFTRDEMVHIVHNFWVTLDSLQDFDEAYTKESSDLKNFVSSPSDAHIVDTLNKAAASDQKNAKRIYTFLVPALKKYNLTADLDAMIKKKRISAK